MSPGHFFLDKLPFHSAHVWTTVLTLYSWYLMGETICCPLSMQRTGLYVGKGEEGQMIFLGSWSPGSGTSVKRGKMWREQSGDCLPDTGERREEDHWAFLLCPVHHCIHRRPPGIWSKAGEEKNGKPRLQLQTGTGEDREMPIAQHTWRFSSLGLSVLGRWRLLQTPKLVLVHISQPQNGFWSWLWCTSYKILFQRMRTPGLVQFFEVFWISSEPLGYLFSIY